MQDVCDTFFREGLDVHDQQCCGGDFPIVTLDMPALALPAGEGAGDWHVALPGLFGDEGAAAFDGVEEDARLRDGALRPAHGHREGGASLRKQRRKPRSRAVDYWRAVGHQRRWRPLRPRCAFYFILFSSVGKRSDLKDACDKILAGATMDTISTEHPATFVRCHRGLRELAAVKLSTSIPSWRTLSVLVLQGRTGTGKTRKAIEVCIYFFFYFLSSIVSYGSLWWRETLHSVHLQLEEYLVGRLRRTQGYCD